MSGSTVSTSSPASAAAPEVPLAQRARSVPRPRAHLTRCQGVFAPNFKPRHVGMADPERGPAKDELAGSRGNCGFVECEVVDPLVRDICEKMDGLEGCESRTR